MKKITFLVLFACATIASNAQTKATAPAAEVKKEKACKPGDACCKKKGDKKSCDMSKMAKGKKC